MIGRSEKERLDEIDICRGFGIVLVVLGHALKQTGESNAFFDVLLSLIYSFHMPLFFVLSGLVAVKILDLKTWKEKSAYIKDRAFRFLIPYFAIGVVYLPVKMLLSRYAVKPFELSSVWRLMLGDNPNVSLWFLYILFWCCALCALLLRREWLNVVLIPLFLLSAAAHVFDWSLRMPKYLFYFVFGIFFRVHYGKIIAFIKRRRVWLPALLLFVAANIFLYLDGYGMFSVVTSLTGICIGFALALHMTGGESVLTNLFRLLGNYSMDIYILSEPVNTVLKLLFWVILKWNYVICTLLCFAFGLALPIPVSKQVIRRVKLLRTLVLGIK